ncbi:tetratricopeptide repeat protein [Pseudenhygromyxa sp. WMMC2535]|uniref:tetratricopeptide repeat protein n=1 Tax=Pseudenhygromyxa sp. WMMC2535 TaxID=2712867 RepID=UPI001554913A|nr:tetratricopeptide repeat protein [Pseudenhygromyxa sp. WMMC2535]NVB38010.1 tetratricopeptide repeat protein [Pseudenhygromyxa sp. WMMC2535]
MRSVRSLLSPLSLALLLALPGATTGCAKTTTDGTKVPKGKSKEEVEAEQAAAAKNAKVNELITLANEDLQMGRYISAYERGEEALADNPDNADAYVVIGAAKWRAGDFAASTEALRKAIELDPKNYGAAVALSRNLRASGQFEEALSVLTPVIEAENEGFENKSCETFEDCEDIGGWCDAQAKVCKAPVGLDSRIGQLWSHYVLADAEAGPAVADEVFLSGAADGIAADAIRGYADFLRAFQGKGELLTVEGETGTSDLGLHQWTGLKFSFATVGGQPTTAMLSEMQIESHIDADMAASLGLEPLGKVSLFNLGGYDVVLVPEVEFKGLKIKNIPAVVDDLSAFGGANLPDEKPGIILGHQVMHRLGSVVADFPAGSLTVTKAAPAAAPSGAAEVPLLFLDQWSIHIPATQAHIDGSEYDIWIWLGGIHPSAISTTEKAYLKSDHLPREVENPEDVEGGRKMVLVDAVSFGEQKVASGVGGLVYLEQPGEPGIAGVRAFAGFELGGYANVPLMNQLKFTYLPAQGKLWVEAP